MQRRYKMKNRWLGYLQQGLSTSNYRLFFWYSSSPLQCNLFIFNTSLICKCRKLSQCRFHCTSNSLPNYIFTSIKKHTAHRFSPPRCFHLEQSQVNKQSSILIYLLHLCSWVGSEHPLGLQAHACWKCSCYVMWARWHHHVQPFASKLVSLISIAPLGIYNISNSISVSWLGIR